MHKLRARLLLKSHTLKDFATQAGISDSELSHYLKGRRVASEQKRELLAKIATQMTEFEYKASDFSFMCTRCLKDGGLLHPTLNDYYCKECV